MSPPHLGISYIEDMPAEPFDELAGLLQHPALHLRHEPRPRPGPYAGIEWLLPTAAIIYLSKSYFDAFLSEAGKDHYCLLKVGLRRLTEKLSSSNASAVQIVSAGGKLKSDGRYSLIYSLVAQLSDEVSAKLLLRTDGSAEEHKEAVDCFLRFLELLHAGELDVRSVKGLPGAQPVGRMLLLEFNPETKALEVVDPLPQHAREPTA